MREFEERRAPRWVKSSLSGESGLLFAAGFFVGVVMRSVLLGVLLFALGAILFAFRGYLNTGDKAVAGALIFVSLVALGIEAIVCFLGPRAAMKKKYLVELSEQEYLHKLISSGTAPARKLNRARILLKAHDVVGKHAEAKALSDRQIARMLWRPPLPQSKGRANASTREDCEQRNRLGTSVEWRFTTEDARIKLRKLYPSIDT